MKNLLAISLITFFIGCEGPSITINRRETAPSQNERPRAFEGILLESSLGAGDNGYLPVGLGEDLAFWDYSESDGDKKLYIMSNDFARFRVGDTRGDLTQSDPAANGALSSHSVLVGGDLYFLSKNTSGTGRIYHIDPIGLSPQEKCSNDPDPSVNAKLAYLVGFNDRLYYRSVDSSGRYKLFKCDPGSDTVSQLSDFVGGGSDYARDLVPNQNGVYFLSYNSSGRYRAMFIDASDSISVFETSAGGGADAYSAVILGAGGDLAFFESENASGQTALYSHDGSTLTELSAPSGAQRTAYSVAEDGMLAIYRDNSTGDQSIILHRSSSGVDTSVDLTGTNARFRIMGKNSEALFYIGMPANKGILKLYAVSTSSGSPVQLGSELTAQIPLMPQVVMEGDDIYFQCVYEGVQQICRHNFSASSESLISNFELGADPFYLGQVNGAPVVAIFRDGEIQVQAKSNDEWSEVSELRGQVKPSVLHFWSKQWNNGLLIQVERKNTSFLDFAFIRKI